MRQYYPQLAACKDFPEYRVRHWIRPLRRRRPPTILKNKTPSLGEDFKMAEELGKIENHCGKL
jgi:hypothetical protein